MGYELFLAGRYLRGNQQTLGGALTSYIAIGGVMVGVAALVVTLAVMTGFREDIRNKILGAQPHLLVMGSGGELPEGNWSQAMADVPQIKAWAPFVMSQALIRRGGITQGVVAKGVDPDQEALVTGLAKHVKAGSWDALKSPAQGAEVPILLGKELARTLHAEVGDQVLVASPGTGLNIVMDVPNLAPFTVAGLLQTGLYDYDSSLAVMPMAAAQHLFQMKNKHTGLGVRLADPEDSIPTAMRLQKRLGSAAMVRSWLMMNQNLFAALRLEKIVMFIILTLITLVAAFTIVSNLLLVTASKTREIGVLRAMGATRWSVEKIFLIKGILMGALGTAAGLGLGLVLAAVLKRYQFVKLPADVYYVENLPVRVIPSDVAMIAGAALLIVLLATLYPARVAAKLDALSAIRHS